MITLNYIPRHKKIQNLISQYRMELISAKKLSEELRNIGVSSSVKKKKLYITDNESKETYMIEI